MNSTDRNIYLAYALSFLKSAWFWLGIWVFYYLRFTDYAGIGLIETVLIVTMTLFEIPTGAIADLLGKKKTLILSFALSAFCNLYMALAGSFSDLILAVFAGALGLTFASGAFEALVFDSLKEVGQEERYDRVTATTNSLSLVAIAVSGSIGGFLYLIDPRLPFFMVGAAFLVALLLSFFLTEPKIDTEQFNWQAFVRQNRQGLLELKKLLKVERLSWVLIPVLSLYVISDEMLESFLGFEFGFSEREIGIFFSLVFIVAAFASQITPFLRRKIGERPSVLGLTVLMGVSYALAPVVGKIFGLATIMVRESSSRNLQNLTSVVFNRHIESKYRATTLSTFNMLKNLPYALSAFALGAFMDLISARNFALILGGLILGLVAIYLLASKREVKGALLQKVG